MKISDNNENSDYAQIHYSLTSIPRIVYPQYNFPPVTQSHHRFESPRQPAALFTSDEYRRYRSPVNVNAAAMATDYVDQSLPRLNENIPPSVSAIPPVQDLFFSTLATTIEKIGIPHDFPTIQIQKFNGSPQNFPVFRQRFEQMIQSKPLDESTKMSRLLQLLEGALMKRKSYMTL